MAKEQYVRGKDILYYERAIKSIKKSEVKLKPIFEAFTNSLESLFDPKQAISNPRIMIGLYHNKTLVNDRYDFEEIVIEDNGYGFNEDNFNRFKIWCDDRKGVKNRGLGRAQMLHYFKYCTFVSIFKENDNGLKQRNFVLSKSDEYLKQNAIIKDLGISPTESKELKTTIRMRDLFNERDQKFYEDLSTLKLKNAIVSHYLPYFCTLQQDIPDISIHQYYDNKYIENETRKITVADIPQFDKEDRFTINYLRVSEDGSSVIQTEKQEEITIRSFRIPASQLEKNEIKLTVKNEIVENHDIKFLSLGKKDQINQNRYLVLLSGNYFDNLDGETRGNFEIPTIGEIKKRHSSENSLFDTDEICVDSIVDAANERIFTFYSEIRERLDEHKKELNRLQDMFLLSEETLNSFKHDLSETDAEVLDKVYKADVAITAKKDANIKRQIDKLESLVPGDEKYNEDFGTIVSELVKEIPQQNRSALIRYIARRRLILELFNKILRRELSIQNLNNDKRNIDEKLLHSLIFQQSSDNTLDSDLWLLNEEFIYFKGASETRLIDIEINGEKVFDDELDEREQNYLTSLGENRTAKRPDILLFPEEGKCIIIEFKNPSVSVRTHLHQIDFYAGLIRNFSKEIFNLDTFYGYLIGQAIEPTDVRLTDQRYMHSYHFDYMYRPATAIAGDIFPPRKRSDGSIYVEIMKYSSLLERAIARNKLFLEKISTGQIVMDDL